MMGRALPRLDLPVIKGMNGLVLLTGRGPLEDGFGPCIACGRCLDACPLGLEPDQVLGARRGRPPARHRAATARSTATSAAAARTCVPSGRPLVQFMQVAKGALRRAARR